jgi:tetratricopeptide (TPR) repeat protein
VRDPRAIASGVVFAILTAVGFLPLFGGPGYEQSLASGLVVPSAAAIATALDLSVSKRPPLACLTRGVASGALLAGVAFLTALLHGLRVGICDFWGGADFFALTAGWGGAMGGAWGVVVAEVSRGRASRRLACVLFGLAAPLAGIVVSVARFFGSPMIFAYDPFFGFFSGTLYDTIVDVRVDLWTYRAGSLATLVGMALVASALRRTAAGGLEPVDLRSAPVIAARGVLGIVALAASAAMGVEGPRLGHWQTAASIAQALGGRAAGPRCDVLHPDSLLADEAALLVRDCEEDLSAVERRLGARLGGRLTVYAFRDANEKRVLMGAAQTSIAKPWRREVYVQLSAYPHPILGHEIAHVVAGTFGRGPFRIAGGAGGLLPNPGLIEGIAVAASPDDDELSDAQWARAMLDLGALPPIRRLFSLGFLGENAAKSYTLAGAFVSWVLDRWGSSVARAWYGGASLQDLTALTWDELDDQFRRSLGALRMPAEASAYAKARFDRPSVWARKCPHVVDALDRDGDGCRDDRRFARAVELYDRALSRDSRDWHARFERDRIDLRYGDTEKGRRDLDEILRDDQAPRTWRDRAQEALADDDLDRGRDELAYRSYRDLGARTVDEDVARTLEVKARSIAVPAARRAIVDLLIGEPGRPVDAWLGALSLGAWAAGPRDQVSAYLVGKNLAQRAQYARAALWLEAALEAGAPRGRVGRELLRQRAICACVLADRPGLERVRALVSADDSPFEDGPGGGRKEWVLRLIGRCGPG